MRAAQTRLLLRWIALVVVLGGISHAQDKAKAWPAAVQKIEYKSSADHSSQPAMFYASNSKKPRPLLVALHTWSFDYTQPESIPHAEWCIEKDWVFIHPNFRGPNTNPRAMGSTLVIADILSAVDYAKANAAVDASRIYLIGESGGGYEALLMAGRAPEVWAGVSAWVPVFDLNSFFRETSAMRLKYAVQIATACGGLPTAGTPADSDCRRRSPSTYLAKAANVPIDINAGIRDGRDEENPVPIRQSLHAFNLLASPADQFSEDAIETMTKTATVPESLRFSGSDPLYGDKKVLVRRQSGKVRITLFDGAHEIIPRAGLAWLAEQKKP